MHADELDITEALVRRLLQAQLPRWADLPLRTLRWGTVNAVYRLGESLLVRLPRREEWADAIALEHTWLPFLAPRLPAAIPEPVALCVPGEGYPLPWAVFRWLAGTPMPEAYRVDQEGLAEDLASFVLAMQGIPLTGGEPTGGRGGPLADRDAPIRASIARLAGEVDADAVTAYWEHALAAPAWGGPPVWLHGDLMPTNLLIEQGRLAGVLDFGSCSVGDPACESLLAWMSLDRHGRTRYRTLVDLDDATWARARGWALSCAVMALPYYRETYPVLADVARRTFAEVLADNLE